MSPVEFKKTLCHPVEFKGQGPRHSLGGGGGDGSVILNISELFENLT